MLGTYRQDLARLRRQLAELAGHAAQAGEGGVQRRAQDAAERIAPRPFRVAFVGEFKAGKSTLINALVGREALAVATRECTTVVTRVRSAPGAEGHAVARTASGAERPMSLEAARDAVQRREQEADPLVEVELALPDITWLDGDVELVDTPGTGAVGRVREQVTLGWLPNADAVVFVTRADQLLNTTEMAFLKEGVLSLDPAGLFIVINRKDQISTARDRAALEQRAVERLAHLGEPKVLWTSAADAMDAIDAIQEVYGDQAPDPEDVADWEQSGVPELRDALRAYLANDRVADELARHRRTFTRLVEELEARLVHRLRVAELDGATAERERQRAKQLESALRKVRVELREEITAAFSTTCRQRLRDAVGTATGEANGLLAGATDPHTAARDLESLGTRALGRLQRVLANEWRQIRETASVRLVEIEAHALKAAGDPAVRTAMGELDLSRTLHVERRTHEVVERQELGTTSADNAATVAAIGTMIGYAVAGPVGGLIGAWAGVSMATQPTFQEVRRQVEEQVVDRHRTLATFRAKLDQAADHAREVAEQITLTAVDEEMERRIVELARRAEPEPPTTTLGQQTLRATLQAVQAMGAHGR